MKENTYLLHYFYFLSFYFELLHNFILLHSQITDEEIITENFKKELLSLELPDIYKSVKLLELDPNKIKNIFDLINSLCKDPVSLYRIWRILSGDNTIKNFNKNGFAYYLFSLIIKNSINCNNNYFPLIYSGKSIFEFSIPIINILLEFNHSVSYGLKLLSYSTFVYSSYTLYSESKEKGFQITNSYIFETLIKIFEYLLSHMGSNSGYKINRILSINIFNKILRNLPHKIFWNFYHKLIIKVLDDGPLSFLIDNIRLMILKEEIPIISNNIEITNMTNNITIKEDLIKMPETNTSCIILLKTIHLKQKNFKEIYFSKYFYLENIRKIEKILDEVHMIISGTSQEKNLSYVSNTWKLKGQLLSFLIGELRDLINK